MRYYLFLLKINFKTFKNLYYLKLANNNSF